jgi:hypothetical protein
VREEPARQSLEVAARVDGDADPGPVELGGHTRDAGSGEDQPVVSATGRLK